MGYGTEAGRDDGFKDICLDNICLILDKWEVMGYGFIKI